MIYVEAPNYNEEARSKSSLFLAGGISDCADWQSQVVPALAGLDIAVYNPRRSKFPTDRDVTEEQITWEYTHMRKASVISFWFCKETLCPITLFELGAWEMTTKPLIVGMDPDYQRRSDVEIQTRLARPELQIVYSLKELLLQIYMSFR